MTPDSARDWRTEYVVCQHVADDEKLGTRHRGFDVCCEDCYALGFLGAEMDTKTLPDGLCVGTMRRPGEIQPRAHR